MQTTLLFKESDLVLVRLPASINSRYTNTWWRVLFIDNDNTFIGELERCHWYEFNAHEKGEHVRLGCDKVQHVYMTGEQFCYSDNISICSCVGLCQDK